MMIFRARTAGELKIYEFAVSLLRSSKGCRGPTRSEDTEGRGRRLGSAPLAGPTGCGPRRGCRAVHAEVRPACGGL